MPDMDYTRELKVIDGEIARFKCKYCGNEYLRYRYLSKHIRVIHKDLIFEGY